jgi:hypothetical protein
MWVPPIVFAGAPIVNAVVTMAWHPPAVKPSPLYYVGIVLAAFGAGLVLYEKGNAEDKSRKAATAAVIKPVVSEQSPSS